MDSSDKKLIKNVEIGHARSIRILFEIKREKSEQ
jgi:hypothetical protein